MEEVARSACIAAINTYHREHLIPLVVCSRQIEYEAAAVRQRLALQSAVVVQPLSEEQVETTLRTAGTAFSGVRAALDQQSLLRELATTPLMLSVLLLTYQGTSCENLARQETGLEQQVWTDYVARMVRRKGDEARYPLELTRSWLTYLAQQMRVHQQAIFYAEYLHTDWLTSKQQRTIMWLTLRIPGFVIGALVGVLILFFVLRDFAQGELLQVGLIGGFVGDYLSRNTSTGTTAVRSHASVSKRERLMSCMLIGTLVAATAGLQLYSPLFYDPYYSLNDWLRDGIILGLGSGLSAWVSLALLFRLPKQQDSVVSANPSLRWRISAWFITMAPQRIWQAAFMLGAGIGLSDVLNIMLSSLGHNLRQNHALMSYGINNNLRASLAIGLGYGLRIGPSLGLVVILVSIILNVSLGTLRFAERIHWVWYSLLRPKHLRTSVIVTSVVFLLLGLGHIVNSVLMSGLAYGLSDRLGDVPSNVLIFGLSYWFLFGLYQGVVQEHIKDQDRHLFNQGIRRSLRNGALMSLVSASILTGMGVLSVWLSIEIVWLSIRPSDALGHELSNLLSHELEL